MPQLAPAPEPSPPADRLARLREELDRIDDALHDLLMRRAEVVAAVAALRAKGNVALRPGREAAILRRLLRRNRGALDRVTLAQVWREILNGSTAQQQALRIATAPGLEPLTRAHFGARPTVVALSGAGAIDAVASGQAGAAVLRWPGRWWTALIGPPAPAVHVVARLPLLRDGAAAADDAMVLTAAEPDPSGEDRSLLAAPLTAAALRALLAARGLAPIEPLLEEGGWALAELPGFVAAGDALLAALPSGSRIVGAYAVPLETMP